MKNRRLVSKKTLDELLFFIRHLKDVFFIFASLCT